MAKWLMRMAVALLAGGAVAGDVVSEPVTFRVSAHVEVGTDGVPTVVEARGRLPDPIRQAVEQHVLQFRFEPVVIDGQARTASTHVFLDACAVQQPDGQLNLAMDYRSNCPGHASGDARSAPPAYPRRAAEIAAEGTFDLVVRVDVDGSASIESIKRIRGNQRLFESDLRAWVEANRYIPEQVDGVPVATRFSTHVDFYVFAPVRQGRGQAQQEQLRASTRCAAANAGGNAPADPVVLDSPLKLVPSS